MISWSRTDNDDETQPSDGWQDDPDRPPTIKTRPKRDGNLVRYALGKAYLGSTTPLLIYIPDVQLPLVIHPAPLIVMGRLDADTTEDVSLDLTPYEAHAKGVSRLHAVLHRTEGTISIEDMESANGTFVNGRRLIPHQPHLLRDGDEIVLGTLSLRVAFQ
ncbi:MAG: FHA domain-containing protein [Anaerolineae bacterium]|nr:FHA domain-containing protein [Anaerolineae bacterium]